MNQEQANKIFNTSLGQQIDMFYCTSDDRVFIRDTEADLHTKGLLDANTLPLEDKTITEWYPDDSCFEDNAEFERLQQADIKEYKDSGLNEIQPEE